jgi:hypothetical protein
MSVHPLRPNPAPKPRNPNRWLIYGAGVGCVIGWWVGQLILGLIIGLMMGVGLRHREFEQADDDNSDDSPQTLH